MTPRDQSGTRPAGYPRPASDSTLVLLESLDGRLSAVESEIGSLSQRVEPALAGLERDVRSMLDLLEHLRLEVVGDREATMEISQRLRPVEYHLAVIKRRKRAAVKLALAGAAAALAGIVKWLFSAPPQPPHM